jgi:hypothetical protein
MPVELAQRRHDLLDGAEPLHGDLAHLDVDRGPPAAGVLEDVALRGAVAAGDEPDAARQERQRTLAVGGEQPLAAMSALSRSSRASSSPTPTGRISVALRLSVPRPA